MLTTKCNVCGEYFLGDKCTPACQIRCGRSDESRRVKVFPKKKNKKTKKKKRRGKQSFLGDGFYKTRKWNTLRYAVLKKYGRECMCCGATEGQMHVDHIIPKSKNKLLELAFTNLQVLCRQCNLGKSNWDDTDFRPKEGE